MTTSTTTNRRLAIAAGVAAAIGALAILLSDPIRASLAGEHGLWTVKHLLTILTVGITITVGHLVMKAAKEWRMLAAAGFAAMFVLGSALTIYWSVGRQSEASLTKATQIEQTNQRHARVSKQLGEAEAMLETARAKHAAECATGAGRKCSGIQATIDVYEAAVAGRKAELKSLVVRPANPEADTVADVIVLLTGGSKEKTKAVLVLFEPFAPALFFEIVSIVAFGYGFGRRHTSPASAAHPAPVVASPVQAPPAPLQWPAPPPANGAKSKQEALADLLTIIALNQPVPSQDWLAARWGVWKGTVSRWISEWEQAGLVSRTAVGRCRQIEAA